MSDAIFLKAIRANPDDDLPRLVYADWLEENGHAVRAEFIRVQCELAATPEHEPRYRILEDREHEILSEYEPQFLGSSWPKDWRLGPGEWTWKRGFLDEVHICFGSLLDAGYLTEHPVRSLHVSSDYGQPIELLERRELQPLFQGLQSINMHGWANLDFDQLKQFIRSDWHEQLCYPVSGLEQYSRWSDLLLALENPRLCNCLRSWIFEAKADYQQSIVALMRDSLELELTDYEKFAIERRFLNALGDHQLRSVNQWHADLQEPNLLLELLRSPAGQALESLELRMSSRGKGLLRLAEGESWPLLRSLDIDHHSIGDDLFELLNTPPFVKLKDLSLSVEHFQSSDWLGLVDTPYWSQAKKFRLDGRFSTPSEHHQVVFSSGLRELTIDSPSLTADSISAILDGLSSEELIKLRLHPHSSNQDMFTLLANSDRLANLRALHLNPRSYEFFDCQARSLVQSPHLRKLRQLALGRNVVKDLNVEELFESSEWSLTDLSIWFSNSSDLYGLIDQPKLARLNALELGGHRARWSEAQLLLLAESPYLSRLCELRMQSGLMTYRAAEAFQARLGPRFVG